MRNNARTIPTVRPIKGGPDGAKKMANASLTTDFAAMARRFQLADAGEDMLAALVECRAEISRINAAAGETRFNPAATTLVDAAIAKAEGRANG